MTFPDSQRVAEARPVSRPRCARRVPRSQSLDTGLRAPAYIQLFRECHFQSDPSEQRRVASQNYRQAKVINSPFKVARADPAVKVDRCAARAIIFSMQIG
jgi:hypothetical protein